MTNKEFEASALKEGNLVWTYLPRMELCGWKSPSGAAPYMKGVKNKELFHALLEFASARTVAQRTEIRNEIINQFYGGEENFQKIKENLINGIQSIT